MLGLINLSELRLIFITLQSHLSQRLLLHQSIVNHLVFEPLRVCIGRLAFVKLCGNSSLVLLEFLVQSEDMRFKLSVHRRLKAVHVKCNVSFSRLIKLAQFSLHIWIGTDLSRDSACKLTAIFSASSNRGPCSAKPAFNITYLLI